MAQNVSSAAVVIGALRVKPSSKMFLLTIQWRYFFCASFMLFMSSFCHASTPVCCCFAVTLPLGSCVFVTFPCGILGQVRHLIVSIPDFSRLSYFKPETDVCVWLGPPWVSCVFSLALTVCELKALVFVSS